MTGISALVTPSTMLMGKVSMGSSSIPGLVGVADPDPDLEPWGDAQSLELDPPLTPPSAWVPGRFPPNGVPTTGVPAPEPPPAALAPPARNAPPIKTTTLL